MLHRLREELNQFAVPAHERKAVFFKTKPGDYAAHDQFLGVPSPQLRKLAKKYHILPLEQVIELLQSPINDERLLALFMLVNRYQKGDATLQEEIYQLYQTHIKQVNNWNLVDASAHLIVGAHLYQRDKAYLLDLAQSQVLWERRIAIVSTWYDIRQNEFSWTISLAERLLQDTHDLIHKAVGWMLREMGKRDEAVLITFLEKHADEMPRTMLRYAIEKLDNARRVYFMNKSTLTPGKVIIYSTAHCPYCVRAKELLKRKGISFTEIMVDEDDAKREEMIAKTGRYTVPQIFIDGKHIGGCDDLYALERSGNL